MTVLFGANPAASEAWTREGAGQHPGAPRYPVDVRAVALDVLVTDQEGRFVSGLRPNDFRVLEQGVPQELSFFSAHRTPVTIVVLLDSSASVRSDILSIQKAANRFIKKLASGDRARIGFFHDQVVFGPRFTDDMAEHSAMINQMRPQRSTHLYDALIESFEKLERVPDRKVLLVFSDGEDQGSRTSTQGALEAARHSDVSCLRRRDPGLERGRREAHEPEASRADRPADGRTRRLPREREADAEGLRSNPCRDTPSVSNGLRSCEWRGGSPPVARDPGGADPAEEPGRALPSRLLRRSAADTLMPPDPRRLCLVPLLVACVAAAGAQDVGQSLRDWAQAGQTQSVRDLLAEVAPDLDAADGTGRTALMYAVEGGHDEIAEMLLNAGASVDRRDQSGETALHLAARHGRTAAARLLLQAGADFGLRDAEGRTPLYRAIERRRADIIEMLQVAAAAKGKGPMSQTTFASPEQTLPPTIVESTPAPYTESALAKGIEGTVVLMVLVRRDGSVGAASVSRGLEASLDETALRTVKEWKFAPAMRQGKTVEVVLEVEVSFQRPAEP